MTVRRAVVAASVALSAAGSADAQPAPARAAATVDARFTGREGAAVKMLSWRKRFCPASMAMRLTSVTRRPSAVHGS